jgi:hypothetical protein
MREKGWEELTFVSQLDSMETRPLLQAGAARPRPFAALTTPMQEEEKEKGEGKQARRRCQERGLQQPWQHRTMRRGREGAGGTEEEEDAPPWGGSRPIGGRKRRQLIGGEWF